MASATPSTSAPLKTDAHPPPKAQATPTISTAVAARPGLISTRSPFRRFNNRDPSGDALVITITSWPSTSTSIPPAAGPTKQ